MAQPHNLPLQRAAENATSSHITPNSIAIIMLLNSSDTLTSMLLEALVTNFIVAAISIIAGSSDVKGTMMAIVIPLLLLREYCG